jgi:predicted PurR-regulated permease PerM
MPDRLAFPGGERAAFFLALLAALYFAYVIVRPVLVILLLAAALASLLTPAHDRLRARLHGRARLSAATCVLLVLAGVIAPVVALGFAFVPRLIAQVDKAPMLLERATAHLGFARPLVARAGDAAPAAAAAASKLLAGAGRGLVALTIGIFLMSVATYYFLLDGRRFSARLVRLLPLREEDVRLFQRRFHQVSLGVLIGALGTAAVQAVVAGLGYWMFGVAAPLLFTALTFVAALVPAVGTLLVWAPLAAGIAIAGDWPRGLGLALWGALAVGTIDNLVRPILTRAGLDVHPLVAFVAVFGGVAAMGVSGLFLGPLALTLAASLLDVYERRMPPRVPS